MFERIKAKAKAIIAKVKVKTAIFTAAPAAVAAASVIPVFAADPVPTYPTVAITSDMLTPLVEGVVANIGVILPCGIGLMAIFLGIRLIPGLLSRFVHM